jgi:hypothetical protein
MQNGRAGRAALQTALAQTRPERRAQVTEQAILIVARSRRFLLMHSDGTSEYFDYDGKAIA